MEFGISGIQNVRVDFFEDIDGLGNLVVEALGLLGLASVLIRDDAADIVAGLITLSLVLLGLGAGFTPKGIHPPR